MIYFFVLLVIGLLFFRTPTGKGVLGEFVVNLMAKIFLDKNTYHVLRNVTLPTESGTTQIDHIIISQYGIFVVETKNMKGWIFGSKNQKEWTQKIFKTTIKFQNPLRQNYKHTQSLAAALDLDHSKIFSLIVFVGESTFKTDMPENVTYGKGYIRYIESKTVQQFSKVDVLRFIRIIKEKRFEPNFKTHRDHVAHVREIHSKDIAGKDLGINAFATEGSDNKGELGGNGLGATREMTSLQGNQTSTNSKPKVVVAVGIVGLLLISSLLYFKTAFVGLFQNVSLEQKVPSVQTEGSVTTGETSKGENQKEYSFSEAQINSAMKEVEKARSHKSPVSRPSGDKKHLYEIEFVSGGRIYTKNVSISDHLVSFENERGLLVSVGKGDIKKMKRLVEKKNGQGTQFSCRGKTHCSQMTSCEEAIFYLRNCPGVQIDGNNDGVPCEKQWCGN